MRRTSFGPRALGRHDLGSLQDMSVEEVVEEFDVTPELIEAVLGLVAQSLQFSVSARARFALSPAFR